MLASPVPKRRSQTRHSSSSRRRKTRFGAGASLEPSSNPGNSGAHGLLAERFGPLVIYLQPQVVAGSLEITDVRSTLLGLPLPPFLTPQVFARGVDNGPGIDIVVRISCSPFGLLVEYKGIVS